MDFLATARRQMLAGQINDARERLLQSYAGLSDAEMTAPGVCGEWSVRDILAHIAAWDRATTEAYRAMLRGEFPPFLDFDEEGIQAFNEEHHAATRDARLEGVMTELPAAREEMVELLREVDNEALFEPAPGDEQDDLSIAACIEVTAGHDEEHAEMIETWREGQGK